MAPALDVGGGVPLLWCRRNQGTRLIRGERAQAPIETWVRGAHRGGDKGLVFRRLLTANFDSHGAERWRTRADAKGIQWLRTPTVYYSVNTGGRPSTTSHVGNAGSTPAGITRSISSCPPLSDSHGRTAHRSSILQAMGREGPSTQVAILIGISISGAASGNSTNKKRAITPHSLLSFRENSV
jgi:hypothetical protein